MRGTGQTAKESNRPNRPTAKETQMQRKTGLFSVPFIYGSTAVPISKKDSNIDPSHTHKWSVYVKGLEGADISWLFKKVIIKIHETFPNPNRSFYKEPFLDQESGWGEFQITFKLILHDTAEKPITLHHYLQLYSKNDPGKIKTVVSEFYDEVVFVDPIESVHDAILSNQVSLLAKKTNCNFDLEDEATELRRLDGIYKNLCDEYSILQSRFLKVDEELAKQG